MKVRELINKLLDIQASFDEEVNICIRKEEDQDAIVYVANKDSITISEPEQIGDRGVWIEGFIGNDPYITKKSGQLHKSL